MSDRLHIDEITPARFVDLAAGYDFRPRVKIGECGSWELIVDIRTIGLSQPELDLWCWLETWLHKPREAFPATDHSHLWLVTIEALRRGLIAAESAASACEGSAQ